MFKYDKSVLSKEQVIKIEAAEDAFKEQMQNLIDEENRRMERYYNGEDDYSFGGLCSIANSNARAKLSQIHSDCVESIVRGGFVLKQTSHSILTDKFGNLVSTEIKFGKYGCFFKDGDKFISVPKTNATLERKGYKMFRVDRIYACVPCGETSTGKLRYKDIRLEGEDMFEDVEPHSKTWIDYCYENPIA